MQLTKREVKLLVLAVVIIGGSLVYKWGVKPLISSHRSLENRLSVKQREWANKKRLLQESKRYKKSLQQAQAETRELAALTFAANINHAQLKGLSVLESQIKQSGLEVKNKELRLATPDNATYDLIYYDFALGGSLQALTNFLKGLNEAQKLFIIDELQLRQIEPDSPLEIKVAIKTLVVSK